MITTPPCCSELVGPQAVKVQCPAKRLSDLEAITFRCRITGNSFPDAAARIGAAFKSAHLISLPGKKDSALGRRNFEARL